jgi:hypothetical protein
MRKFSETCEEVCHSEPCQGAASVTTRLAVNERFPVIDPVMLLPLGLVFGLLVVFTAAQVWGDLEWQAARSSPKPEEREAPEFDV